jgi:hypothetical protein
MPDVTQTHEEKETLVIDANLPGHDERVTTPTFIQSKAKLMELEGGRSFVTGKTEDESGGPHEAHHFWIERCLANAVDWKEFCEYIERMNTLIQRTLSFCRTNPELSDIMLFVDDMTVNGMLIEKRLHTGKGEGIHQMPFPLWQCWVYGKEGFEFVGTDSIYHVDEATAESNPEG